MNSSLRNKSEFLVDSAMLLHDNNLYPAVAHCSYYACFQLLMHIWKHKMEKTEDDLDILRRSLDRGMHEVLLSEVVSYIKNRSLKDFRINTEIAELKRIRVKADYKDADVVDADSQKAIRLSQTIIPLLKRYC